MAGILNVGTRALLTNQLALQTAGNNIANVNTPGYSRQTVVLQAVEGQFIGAGFYGNGVEAATVLRKYDQFLARQSNLSVSIAAADSKRLDRLRQLEDLFQGGTSGLGAAVSDMLDAFSDVANSPTDQSARAVVLSRVDEAAARFRSTADRLGSLTQAARSELAVAVDSINSLAGRIAKINAQISHVSGSGNDPNTMLDQRDQMIHELNGLVQTTTIAGDDGSLGIFIAGSQPLVLGSTASPMVLTPDEFNNPDTVKLGIQLPGLTTILDETALGGGSVAGLMRFMNSDLVEANNLVGRMALALGTSMNEQHQLGLDSSGTPGGALFNLSSLPDGLASSANLGSATIAVSVQPAPASGATALAASDYEMVFTSATAGNVRRLSDGQLTAFGSTPGTALVDGLVLQASGAASAGDRFLVTPFRRAASDIDAAFASPAALAMASQIAGSAGTTNTGGLALQSLLSQSPNANLTQTVTLTFTGAGSFNVTGAGTGNPVGVAYTPGQPVSFNGWSLTLKGAARAGDTFTVRANAFPSTSGGNAEAMLALRDTVMFDGATASEGYASLMSQIGVKVQSAGFAATVSQSIATNIESDRAAVSGVNLDEEAARLLQFQQAYQASAKILQVSQSMFDSLLQNLGL